MCLNCVLQLAQPSVGGFWATAAADAGGSGSGHLGDERRGLVDSVEPFSRPR